MDDTERRVARVLERGGRRARLRTSPRQQSEAGPFDLIGDIHWCLDTARALLARLGYESVDGWVHRHPEGAGPCSWATTSTGGIPWICVREANGLAQHPSVAPLGPISGRRDRMTKKVEVIMSPRVGRGYSTTTAHGTKAGGFVFVTGQVAVKPNDDAAKNRESIREMGTIAEQTRQVLENIKAILEHAGSSLDLVAKRNIFLSHPGDFDEVHGILEEYFGPMATTCVVAMLIPTSARIEIEVTAVLPD